MSGKRKFDPVDTITLDSSDDEDEPKPRRPSSASPKLNQEDVDLALALELSRRDSIKVPRLHQPVATGSKTRAPSHATFLSLSSSPVASTSTLVYSPPLPTPPMSRAEMERERLERIASRTANGVVLPTARMGVIKAAKRAKVTTIGDLGQPDAAAGGSGSGGGGGSLSTPRTSPQGERFWKGCIKRVSNRFVPDKEGLSLADIVGPKDGGTVNEPTMAIVSSFAIDLPWLAGHFTEQTPLLIIMPRQQGDAGPDSVKIRIPEVKEANLHRCIPPESRDGTPGCMHVKCAILYYKTFMRVVIPTANFVDYDWFQIDNALFIQDFPLLPPSSAPKQSNPLLNPTHTSFSRNLISFLSVLRCSPEFLLPSLGYDFSESRDIRLVTSTQGVFKAETADGVCGLFRAVQSLNFSKDGKWSLEATGSSVGQLSSNWLNVFHQILLGVKPWTVNGTPARNYRPPFKIVFPTLEEVDNSTGGRRGGGTIFCKRETWAARTFPQYLFHKGVSKRDGIISHAKLLVATRTPSNIGSDQGHEAWIYVGSHNFTKAAWGGLQTATSTGIRELKIANYEMGVVLPLREKTAAALEKRINETVTYKRPLVPYGVNDIPWMQFEFPAA